ncbi:hypothetical protein L1049_025959 [Liquidambar formosana]|uniref:Amino acid transporter transmembrane domain-containing protein n=1 Tax=Liquidambar formosana TaxID=63359 RepID=A0AAP0NEL4_LIQFO
MGDNNGTGNQQAFGISIDVLPQAASKCFDDDGRLKRTGIVWTAGAHIITAAIGPGVLSLAWSIAQLGWIAGPAAMLLLSIVTYHTSTLLSACYRSGDPNTGQRNYTYMDAVRSNLGGAKVKICVLIQFLYLFGVVVVNTIATSISLMAIKRSNCFHHSRGKNGCHINSNPYMILFGVVQIILSQIPNFDQLWWFSIVADLMSFTFSIVALGLDIVKVAGSSQFQFGGSLTGISIGSVTPTQKIWRSFQALGNIASTYCYTITLIDVQYFSKALFVELIDTVYNRTLIRSAPSEAETMKKSIRVTVAVTTFFYMFHGCVGYAAFGDFAPRNILTGFGFYNPFWLLDIANTAVVIHLVVAYRVYCHLLFAFVEKLASEKFGASKFITKEIIVPIPGFTPYKLNIFRLVWRTIFVTLATIISMLVQFVNVNDLVGILGAVGFGTFTVYFPIEVYIVQKKIPKWCARWVGLKILCGACLIISIAGASGSFAAFLHDLEGYKPFKTRY